MSLYLGKTEIPGVNVKGVSGDHNGLINRELPDQHPIQAITGLEDELNNKLNLSGGAMRGDLNMNGFKIANLPEAIRSGDPVTFKQLQEAIAGIGTVFNLKGSKPTYSQLPTSGNKIGDVWYVEDESVGYIWIEKDGAPQWEKFGPAIDLSNYLEKSSLEQTTGNDTQNAMSQDAVTKALEGKQPKNKIVTFSGPVQSLVPSNSSEEIYSWMTEGYQVSALYKNTNFQLLGGVPSQSVFQVNGRDTKNDSLLTKQIEIRGTQARLIESTLYASKVPAEVPGGVVANDNAQSVLNGLNERKQNRDMVPYWATYNLFDKKNFEQDINPKNKFVIKHNIPCYEYCADANNFSLKVDQPYDMAMGIYFRVFNEVGKPHSDIIIHYTDGSTAVAGTSVDFGTSDISHFTSAWNKRIDKIIGSNTNGETFWIDLGSFVIKARDIPNPNLWNGNSIRPGDVVSWSYNQLYNEDNFKGKPYITYRYGVKTLLYNTDRNNFTLTINQEHSGSLIINIRIFCHAETFPDAPTTAEVHYSDGSIDRINCGVHWNDKDISVTEFITEKDKIVTSITGFWDLERTAYLDLTTLSVRYKDEDALSLNAENVSAKIPSGIEAENNVQSVLYGIDIDKVSKSSVANWALNELYNKENFEQTNPKNRFIIKNGIPCYEYWTGPNNFALRVDQKYPGSLVINFRIYINTPPQGGNSRVRVIYTDDSVEYAGWTTNWGNDASYSFTTNPNKKVKYLRGNYDIEDFAWIDLTSLSIRYKDGLKNPEGKPYVATKDGTPPDNQDIFWEDESDPGVQTKKLTFTGAVEAEYDGSSEVTVNIPQGGGGGPQVQSDWNVNDETNPAFIKNRVCYTKDPVESVFIPEQTISVTGSPSLLITDATEIKPLTKYKVVINGDVYNEESFYFQAAGGYIIGSERLDPFVITFYPSPPAPEPGFYFVSKKYFGQITISVQEIYEEPAKLPEKYLPDKILRPVGKATPQGGEIFNDYPNNVASGNSSHAEGWSTTASGDSSHAEGRSTTASGNYGSHAEGGPVDVGTGDAGPKAIGISSHAEGGSTTASGQFSHAEGIFTTASSRYQHVQGKYNIDDAAYKYAHIVGNGDYRTNSNAHTLDWEGNSWYQSDVLIGGTDMDDPAAISLKKTSESVANKLSKTGHTPNKNLVTDASGNVVEEEKPTIPTKLPNPNALTFTGGATGTYDGSGAVEINIPNGEEKWEDIWDFTVEQEVKAIEYKFINNPVRKLRIYVYTLPNDVATNYSPFTVWTGDVGWNHIIKFYPPAIPMKDARDTFAQVEIIPLKDGNYAKVEGSCITHVAKNSFAYLREGYSFGGAWKPVDNYDNNCNAQITGISITTYQKFIPGTRFVLQGVK